MIATITASLVSFAPMIVQRDPEHERRRLTGIVAAKDYLDVLGWRRKALVTVWPSRLRASGSTSGRTENSSITV
jgi:hypothetical protein